MRKVGNSMEVIIPKSLLRDLGVAVGDPVEMTLEAGRRARASWTEASQTIAEARDDSLVWPEFGNVEDETLIW